MNGIHDMGGIDGFGPVLREANEPVFHGDWERRMFGVASAIPFSVPFGDDHLRREIERIPTQDYLNASYYELWFRSILSLLVERKVLTEDEIEHFKSGSQQPLSPDAVRPADVEAAVLAGASTRAEKAEIEQSLAVGDRVLVHNDHPDHHTRAPRYVRGRVGTIRLDHGIFNFADTNSQDMGECPQHCYGVEFDAAELWGSGAEAGASVCVDLWESYMTRLDDGSKQVDHD